MSKDEELKGLAERALALSMEVERKSFACKDSRRRRKFLCVARRLYVLGARTNQCHVSESCRAKMGKSIEELEAEAAKLEVR